MNDINISYNNGHGKMCIHLDHFLPCTQIRFKKLLGIIELDYDHQEELKATLEAYMMERLSALEDQLVENAKAYSNYYQEVADWNRLVETEKHPNGVQLTRHELTNAKTQLSKAIRAKKRTQSDINENKRFIEQMKKCLEILKQRK